MSHTLKFQAIFNTDPKIEVVTLRSAQLQATGRLTHADLCPRAEK